MKKLLISILIALLVILAYFAIFEGLSFGELSILSVIEIKEANDTLTSSIEQANALLKNDYPAEQDKLLESIKELGSSKAEYFDLAKVSTEGEITKANTEETYLREYLWTRVGRHATSKGVNIKMDVLSGDMGEETLKNLSFTVDGQYVGIIQFISALENDDKLNFKIENFKMTKGGSNLTATFNVRNVRIKSEAGATNPITRTEEDTTTQGASDVGGQDEQP